MQPVAWGFACGIYCSSEHSPGLKKNESFGQIDFEMVEVAKKIHNSITLNLQGQAASMYFT